MDSTASAAAEASAAEDDPADADPAEHSGQASGGGRKRRRRRKKCPGSGAHAAGAAPTAAAPPEAGRRPTAADERAAEEDLGEAAANSAAAASTEADPPAGFKVCLYCGETKPLGDFLRRTGKRSGGESRRGACRDCRKRRRAAALAADGEAADPLPPSAVAQPPVVLEGEDAAGEAAPKRRIRRPMPEPPASALLEPTREAELRPTRQGTIRMRGRTDKGRRWQQETDLEMARCLVREHAAVVVNRFTIRRLYTNRSFRRYILERDQYTCHFCGEYGDTIDHLLPRAKGGHTTPINCVCACMLCNQNKADRDLDEFMEEAEDPESAEEAVPEASTDQPPSTTKEI
ncbi:hypothetical protein B9G55_09265 [Saccharibacillus sp. O16]|nr:hypothetical protein B9G55_09265 [Saccharibacillus sp. O16]